MSQSNNAAHPLYGHTFCRESLLFPNKLIFHRVGTKTQFTKSVVGHVLKSWHVPWNQSQSIADPWISLWPTDCIFPHYEGTSFKYTNFRAFVRTKALIPIVRKSRKSRVRINLEHGPYPTTQGCNIDQIWSMTHPKWFYLRALPQRPHASGD